MAASGDFRTTQDAFNLDLEQRRAELEFQKATEIAKQLRDRLAQAMQSQGILLKPVRDSDGIWTGEFEPALDANGQAQPTLDARRQASEIAVNEGRYELERMRNQREYERGGFRDQELSLDRAKFAESQRQFGMNAILNAPKGPADMFTYMNKLRGVQGAGLLPGALGEFFQGRKVAAVSDGGVEVPTPLSNTQLAQSMVTGIQPPQPLLPIQEGIGGGGGVIPGGAGGGGGTGGAGGVGSGGGEGRGGGLDIGYGTPGSGTDAPGPESLLTGYAPGDGGSGGGSGGEGGAPIGGGGMMGGSGSAISGGVRTVTIDGSMGIRPDEVQSIVASLGGSVSGQNGQTYTVTVPESGWPQIDAMSKSGSYGFRVSGTAPIAQPQQATAAAGGGEGRYGTGAQSIYQQAAQQSGVQAEQRRPEYGSDEWLGQQIWEKPPRFQGGPQNQMGIGTMREPIGGGVPGGGGGGGGGGTAWTGDVQDADKVRRMFAPVFDQNAWDSARVPDSRGWSEQQWRRLMPAEQAAALNANEEFNVERPEEALFKMRAGSPSFARSAKANFSGF